MNEPRNALAFEDVAQDIFALVDAFRSSPRSPIDLLPGIDSQEQVHRRLQTQADSITRVLGEDNPMGLEDAVTLARNAIFGTTTLPSVIPDTIRTHLQKLIPNKTH